MPVKSRARQLYIPLAASLLVVAAIYVAGLFAMPPEGLTHHDTGAKYLQVRNLRITPTGLDYSINYPSRALDPTLQFVPFREKQFFIDYSAGLEAGRIYLQWPIFLGLLTRIPWKLFGFWGLYIVPLACGVAAAWATWRLALALGLPRGVAWLAVPLAGLATPLGIYSLLFFEHTLAALLLALAVLFAAQATSASGSPRRNMALSGVLLAVAVYFRSELYVMAAVMFALLCTLAVRSREWRGMLAAWLVAFLVGLLPLWAFYAITEGNLLPLHATWYFAGSSGVGEAAPGLAGSGGNGFELPALRYIVKAGWGIVPDSLFGPQTFPSSPIYPLWVGALGVGGVGLCALGALGEAIARRGGTRARWWAGDRQRPIFVLGLVGTLVASAYIALLPQAYHNLHGFVVASPFVALALWPPLRVLDGGKITAQGMVYVTALAHVGAHTLIISALSGLGPISRHEWGQRYLMSAYPALVALALLGLYNLLRAWAGRGDVRQQGLQGVATAKLALGLAGLMVAVGLVFSVRGYAVLYEERTQVKAWQDAVAALPTGVPVVTDDWWLPLNLAAVFYSRPIMLASGDETLARWATQMRARGVSEFAFAGDKPNVFEGVWRSAVPGLEPVGSAEQVRGLWIQRFRVK